MKHLFTFFAVVLLATNFIESASAQFTDDFDAFDASVTGTQVQALTEIRIGDEPDDPFLELGVPASEEVTIENQTFSWGTIFNSQEIVGLLSDNLLGEDFIGIGSINPIFQFNLNPTRGRLNGFCFNYAGTAVQIRVLADGIEVDRLELDQQFSNDVTPIGPFVCWEAPVGVNATSFELVGDVKLVSNLELRFEPEPEVSSSFEKLGDVVTRLELFTMSLEGSDADKAECALDLLEFVSDEVFFELPEGERLSRYGSTVFLGSAYAVHHLNKIDNEEAQLLAEDVICVLEDVVDFEIAYAIENGGRADFIERAEDIAAVAEFIDDDIDNDAIAALVFRRAWLFATFSTY